MLTAALSPIVPIDRRATDRVLLDIQVNLQFGADAAWMETDARLVDLSSRGMFIRCDRIPRLNQRAFLVIHHTLLGQCVALGSPVRFVAGGFGVRFEQANKILRELVFELTAAGTAPGNYLNGATSELRVQISDAPQD